MRAVQLAVNSILPPDLRDYSREYDAKGIEDLMGQVAEKYPDRYSEIAQSISNLGRHASYRQGESLTLDDFKPILDRQSILTQMDQEVAQAKATSKNTDDFQQKRRGIWSQYSTMLQKATQKEGLRQGNNLAYSVGSGARGKAPQLQAMVTTPGLYTDYKGNPIDLFVRHSFSEGLRPAEYLASTFGARKSVISTKSSTAKGGDLSKQMVQSGAYQNVTMKDCGASNGIDLSIDDPSLKNRVLARDAGGLKAGTLIDRHVISHLRKKKVDTLIVRSAETCQAPNGVCAKCLGSNNKGIFPSVGDSVGVTAAQAIGEPICLHEDTLVRMADWSEKKIKHIKPGDVVLGSDINGYLRPTRVVNVFHNGTRPCFKTRVRKGCGAKSEVIELISTTAHKVLSYQGRDFRKAMPVIQPIGKKYSRQCVYLNKEVLGGHGITEPLAPLLGVLTGDGCYNGGVGSAGIGLSCYDPSLERWVREFLDARGLNLRAMDTGEFRLSMKDQYSSFETIEGKLVRNMVKGKLIKEKMWGQGSGDKTLPANINRWNNTSVALYIGGLIATDGCVSGGGTQAVNVSIGSNSIQLLVGIKFLLEKRFGIYCNRITSKTKKRKTEGFYDPNHTLTVSGKPNVRMLAASIPIPGVKQARIDEAVARLTPSDYDRGRYNVISQEFVGNLDTWDIEVDNETHLFVLSNSLIVSNTQGALRDKHTGGMAGSQAKDYSGFDVLNQFVQSPEIFPDRAALAEHDGTIDKVEEAPQGGHYVHIGDQVHYIDPTLKPVVKAGDTVEAGEPLSEGLIDPGDVVRLRGIGEGRHYYAERMKQILDDSGMRADRRNTELIARSAIDHVRIDDPEGVGDFLPDDVTSYNRLVAGYHPPEDTKPSTPTKAIGEYLQAPALHYTIGTRVTPKIAKHLESRNINTVHTTEESPHFEPEMVRLRTASHASGDWAAKMHSSYLKGNLAESAIRGEDTSIRDNQHFAPPLMFGQDFGKNVETAGKF